MGEDEVSILELDSEHRIRERLFYLPIDFYGFFFGQKNPPLPNECSDFAPRVSIVDTDAQHAEGVRRREAAERVDGTLFGPFPA